ILVFNPFEHKRCKDLEHPVHFRVVVQRYVGAGLQQEHLHTAVRPPGHLHVADVYVGDRRALKPRCHGARLAIPGERFSGPPQTPAK
ncbi:unnamed protein product, partial [Pleuronectes platessa]